jgi:hypothetical protein
MNLIERYAVEIGKHLPKRYRSDIQKEIRSTLEDMLEERVQKSGQPANDEMVVALLKEFGKPGEVAASYLPPKQLIGPQLYPIYSLVVKIVLPILAVVLLLTMGLGMVSAGMTPAQVVHESVQALLQTATALLSAFGSITLTFAILERIPWKGIKEEVQEEMQDKDWDPHTLPEVRDVEKFSIPGLAVEIFLNAVVLVILNFFPQIIGLHMMQNGEWISMPILSEAFFRYVPFINALFGLEIALNLYLLRVGRWQTVTRWLQAALKVLWIALAAVMLVGPELVRTSAEALAQFGDGFSFLLLLPQAVAKGTLVLIIVLNSIEVIQFGVQEIRSKT